MRLTARLVPPLLCPRLLRGSHKTIPVWSARRFVRDDAIGCTLHMSFQQVCHTHRVKLVIQMAGLSKVVAASRAFTISGVGLVFWFIFFQYLRKTYGPGAPFFIDATAASRLPSTVTRKTRPSG